MFTMTEHFDDRLSMYLTKSVFFWKNNNVKKYEIEHLLHTFITENVDTVIKTFNNFNVNPNDIKEAIEDGSFFKDYNSTIQESAEASQSGIKFAPSFVEVSTQAFISVHASNPLDTIITTDCMFLNMCISEASKLKDYFDRLGVSSEVLKDYIINLDDIDFEDAIDQLLNKDDDIAGGSSGDTGTDTLDPNPKGKKHKSVKAKNISTKDRSVLNLFGHNLLDDIKNGKIGPVIGRDKEVDMLQEILCRKNKRNALLLGDPGVGKTAIINALAQQIYNGNVPLPLRNKRLFTFDVNSIVSGTRYRGDFEERMKAMMDEIIEKQDVILFIDEFHMIIGAGGNSNSDMSNILKPALANGDVQVIGCTTEKEFSKYIKDGALERRFQIIHVNEPNEEETTLILNGLRKLYEDYHMITITDKAINAAIRYGKQYIPARFAPDKTIDLIDIAGARTKMRTKVFPEEIKALKKQLEDLNSKMDEAAKVGRTDISRKYKEQSYELTAKIKDEEERYIKSIENDPVCITDTDIAEVVAKLTDIPTDKIAQSDADRLLNLENQIQEKIVGQDKAINSICRCIRRNMSGLRDPKKPIGVFLFMGPTGVGKSELTKNIAIEIFGKESNLIKLNMSEYSEKIDVTKITGSGPGFVGYGDSNALTDKVQKNPYSVLLLDEIEKAHKDIYNLFLQIMEDGELVDGTGKKAYFNNCIIIMTSNIGAEKAYNSKGAMGFSKLETKEEKENRDFERISNIMKKECENHFTPEFLNRIDEIISFNKLSHDDLIKIVDLQIDKLNKRLEHRNIKIIITDNLRERIIEKGYNPKYGARPVNRAIQEILGDYMADRLLRKEFDDGMEIEFDFNKEKNEVTHKILKQQKVDDEVVGCDNSNSGTSSSVSDLSMNSFFDGDDEFSKMMKEELK